MLLLHSNKSNGYKILFSAPLPAESHWLFMQHIIKGLLDRHHEVTFITSRTWNGVKPDNYTEILITPQIDLNKYTPQSKIYEADSESQFSQIVSTSKFMSWFAEFALNNSKVQEILHDYRSSYDIVINEELMLDSFLMLSHKFHAPIVTICK